MITYTASRILSLTQNYVAYKINQYILNLIFLLKNKLTGNFKANFNFFFLPAPKACGNSWSRNQTCTTAET